MSTPRVSIPFISVDVQVAHAAPELHPKSYILIIYSMQKQYAKTVGEKYPGLLLLQRFLKCPYYAFSNITFHAVGHVTVCEHKLSAKLRSRQCTYPRSSDPTRPDPTRPDPSGTVKFRARTRPEIPPRPTTNNKKKRKKVAFHDCMQRNGLIKALPFHKHLPVMKVCDRSHTFCRVYEFCMDKKMMTVQIMVIFVS